MCEHMVIKGGIAGNLVLCVRDGVFMLPCIRKKLPVAGSVGSTECRKEEKL